MSCHPFSFGMCLSDREQWVPTPMWTCPVGPPTPLSISSTRVGCRGCRGVERVLAVLVWGPSGQSGWGQAKQGSRCAWARRPGAVLRLCGVSTSPQQIKALLLPCPDFCVWRPLQPSLLLGSTTCRCCPDGWVVRDGAGQGWWVLRQLLCAPASAGPEQPVQPPCPRGV